jgi:hypothetical protein
MELFMRKNRKLLLLTFILFSSESANFPSTAQKAKDSKAV